MTPLIDYIILVFGSFSLLMAVIQIVRKSQDKQSLYINIAIGGLTIGIFLFRKYIIVHIKVLVVALLGIVSIVTSIISNGLMSTGLQTLIALIILLAIFFRAGVAITFSIISLISIVLFTGAINLGQFRYPDNIANRMNNIEQWIPNISTLTAIIIIIISSIHLLKSKMMKNIRKLEISNTRLIQQDKKLMKMAHFDSLTQLPNLTKFKEIFHGRKSEGLLGCGFIVQANIKQFRVINSIAGVSRADEILKEIGRVIPGFVIHPNFSARLNGDEFILWIEAGSYEHLENYIKDFRKYLKTNLSETIPEFLIDMHFSASDYSHGHMSIEDSLVNTGIALKLSKNDSAENVVLFQKDMLHEMEKENSLLKQLRQAIDSKEFEMHYQKKIEIRNNKTTGVEALCRWRDKKGNYISPELFIPVLHRHNLMIPFSRLIVKKVFSEMRELKGKYGKDCTVSINISPVFFLSKDFISFMKENIREFSVHAEKLILEITEDVFIDDINIIQSIIKELKEEGVQIAVDDFGKGFSSLSYISNIDLNELKIDKSFIDGITDSDRQFNVVLSICTIAKALKYKVVAEGVETEEQLEKLKLTSCDIIQGYYASRPEPL